MKRVLVTGGSGAVGRHVLPLLAKRGWDVHALTSRTRIIETPGVAWHHASVLDADRTRAVVRDVAAGHLLHMAWHMEPGFMAAVPENFAWVRSSLSLLEAFHEAGGRRFVGSGSGMEYDWNYGYCSETLTPCAPHTVYGMCKNATQLLTTLYGTAAKSMSTAWGRIFFLYGPYERPNRLVSSVIRSLLAGQPAKCSHGKQIRDYMYAGDIAEAFVNLLESDVSGPLNIASGRPIAIKDLVSEIGRLLGRPELIHLGALAAPATDAPVVIADVTRLERELGWRPGHDLSAGLTETIERIRVELGSRQEERAWQ